MTLHEDTVRVLRAWQPGIGHGARDQTLELLDSGPAALSRAHLAGHVTASVMIVHHDRRHVLLCLHGRFNKWCQLGGHCEDEDATLMGAALREATEESGIKGLVVDPEPIGVNIHAVKCSVGQTHHFDVRFAVLAPSDAEEQVSAESHALGWFLPEALPSPMAHATEELIAPALARFAQRPR